MPNYRLKHKVPWTTILYMQRLHLQSFIYRYGQLEDLQARRKAKDFQIIYRYVMKELRQHYDAYHALRRFLGYNTPTNCEKTVYEILETEEKNSLYQEIFSK